MAGEAITLVSDLPAGPKAGTDLRTHQYKFVQVYPVGVLLADARSAQTPAYVLGNKPNSGEAVSLVIAPNVAKVMVGETITVGNLIEPMSSTGLARAVTAVTSSFLPISAVGQAFSTAAVGSGEMLSVHLRR